MKILVTGGCGFIGSNFIRYLIEARKTVEIVNLDWLTYAGNLENLKEIEPSPNYRFVRGDICDKEGLDGLFKKEQFDGVIHFAAESHVDRSIMGADDFIRTNINGTYTLLAAALKFGVKRYIQISTDEVYGALQLNQGCFTEDCQICPNSPYSASKASADLLAKAYQKTFQLPVIITRSSNNYGPYQFPEKLIPLMITNALENKTLPVYGDGQYVRDWLFVKDNVRAIWTVFEKGSVGEVYNIGGQTEIPNIEVVKTILKALDKPESLITHVKDRPGHDRRYALNISKIQKALGWSPEYNWQQGIAETVSWYVNHPGWLNRLKTQEYLTYYEQWYGERLK